MDQQVPNIVMGTPSPPRLLHWPRTQHSRHSGQCEDNIVIGWPRGGGIHLRRLGIGSQILYEIKYICHRHMKYQIYLINASIMYLEHESIHQNFDFNFECSKIKNTFYTL